MLPLNDTTAGTSLLGRTSGELALRVSGPASASRMVRLAGPKCTIGSSRNCTLRLRASGVSPVHCLILRGAHATIVRRWSPDTLLNGRAFDDAQLAPGDRISVGTIELDVVELSPLQSLISTATDVPLPHDSTSDDPSSEQLAQTLRMRQLERELAARNEQLAAQLQAIETTRLELAEREAAWTRESVLARAAADDERQSLLAQRESLGQLHTQQLDELELSHRELDAERERLEQDRAELQRKAAEQWAELANVRRELATEQQRVAADVAKQGQFDEEAFAKLAAREEQLAAATAELERSRAEFAADQQRLAAELTEFNERRTAEAAKADDLAAQYVALGKERQQLALWQQRFDEQQADGGNELASVRATIERERQQLEAERAALAERRQAVDVDAARLVTERNGIDEQRAQSHALLDEQRAALERQRLELQTNLADVAAEREELRQEREQWEKLRDSDRLPHAISDATDPTDEQQRVAAERQAWESRLADLTTEITQLRSEVAQEREQLATDRDELRERQQRFTEQQSELQNERSRFDEQRSEWDQSQATACDNLILARNMLAEHQTALEIERRSWELQRQDFDTQRQAFESERQAFADERSAQVAEPQPVVSQATVDAQPACLQESHATETDDSPARADEEHTDCSESPAEVHDVEHDSDEHDGLEALNRLRSMWKHDQAEEDTADNAEESHEPTSASFERTSPVNTPAERRTPDRATEHNEEESIEEYMAKLMRRVRGESDSAASTPAPAPAATRREPQPEPERFNRAVWNQADEPTAPLAAHEPFELVPRNRAPELSSNLGAMRELANWSARQAIDTSVRQRWNRAAIGKLFVAITGLVVGTALLQWSEGFTDTPFLGAMLAFVISVFWMLQGGLIVRNIRKANQLEQETADDEHATDADTSDSLVDDKSLATPDEFATDYWAEDDADVIAPHVIEHDADDAESNVVPTNEDGDREGGR